MTKPRLKFLRGDWLCTAYRKNGMGVMFCSGSPDGAYSGAIRSAEELDRGGVIIPGDERISLQEFLRRVDQCHQSQG